MAKRIETLTAEQEKLLAVKRDEWIRIGLSTEPADRPDQCTRAITAEQRAGYYDQIATLHDQLGDPDLAKIYRFKARTERGDLS